MHVIGRKRGTDVFRPRSDEHPDDETWPGLLIMRPEGRIFFANAPVIAEKLRSIYEGAKPKWCCSTSAPCSTSSTPRSRC